jgi:hypothetical protein
MHNLVAFTAALLLATLVITSDQSLVPKGKLSAP